MSDKVYLVICESNPINATETAMGIVIDVPEETIFFEIKEFRIK